MRLYFRANPSELYHTCYHDPFMRGERDHLTDDYLQPRYCDTHLQVLLMNPTMSSSPIIFLLIPITIISFNRYSVSHRISQKIQQIFVILFITQQYF